MKKLAFGALAIGLLSTGLVACGGGSGDDDGDDIQLIDGGIDAENAAACNAAEQTGCGAGEKCTWINIDSANDLGTIGCVAEGTVASGAACAYGPDGEATGFDDCVAGQICISGLCEAICTISPDSCDTNTSCSRYAGLFTGSTPELGACDFLCDPVTQARSADDVAVCGGEGTGTAATRGCYGVFDGDFSCAGVPQTVAAAPQDYTQDQTAYGPASGGAYLNGCAPGFAPLLRNANDAAAPVVCFAFCTPAARSMEAQANRGGLAPNDCAARGADTSECRYFWLWETWDAATDPVHPDEIGFCWDPGAYIGDWDGDALTPDDAIPECGSLPAADPDYLGWGCNAFAANLTGAAKPHKLPFSMPTSFQFQK